jgi:branched-chain amino acid transport system substrate-binding protein
VGLERKALRDQIAKNEFKTILGPMRFEGSENASIPGTVAQWQSGEFEVVWPKNRATAALMPKPAWK